MMHEKSEIDDSSLGDSISPSSSSPKHGYYVQSPSRDSHDDKSSTNSHSTPIESPSHSSHSRMSSSSRVSGPYRFSLVGKHHPNFLRKKKGWPPLFSVIDEDDEDYGDDDLIQDKQFMRQFRFLMLLIGVVMVFTIVCLIIWGASRPYKFQVHTKVKPLFYLKVDIFYLIAMSNYYHAFYLLKFL